MTTHDSVPEHEPLPTPQAAQQEPQFDTRGTWQDYQREHYKWRTGQAAASDAQIPPDEGEYPPPTGTEIALEVFSGFLGSGPGVTIGKGVRPGLGRAPLRPLPPRTPIARPATPARPAGSLFKPNQRVMEAIDKFSRGGRINAGRDTGGAMRPNHSGKPGRNTDVSFLEALLQQRVNSNARAPGQVESVARIQELDFEVPARVWRGHQGNTLEGAAEKGLQRAPGGNLEGDDYLAAIIKHTARQGGSGGEVLSLSGDKAVATGFAKGRNVPVFEIDTTQDPAAFRTINDILLKDAERLVVTRRVTRATVLKAVDNIEVHAESEVFYVKGDIPAEFLIL